MRKIADRPEEIEESEEALGVDQLIDNVAAHEMSEEAKPGGRQIRLDLGRKPVSKRTPGEMAELMTMFAALAKEDNPMCLERFIGDIDMPLLAQGLDLLVDCKNPPFILEILRNQRQALLQMEECRLNIIISGILSMANGDGAKATQMRCRSHLAPREQEDVGAADGYDC